MNDAALLAPDEPDACEVCTPEGRSEFLLIADHAGNRVPRSLRELGLSRAERQRHIAWDIGIAGLARELSRELNACCVLQRYSRLVIDCNRPFAADDSIALQSDGIDIPGNRSLDGSQRRARQREIFEPYHRRIAQELDARAARGQATALIALHSFTPHWQGTDRPWHAGVLYGRDDRLARALLYELRRDPALEVGDNQPYSVGDDTDYAIPRYGEARGLLHVELEIRQDLITEPAGQNAWSHRLAAALRAARDALSDH